MKPTVKSEVIWPVPVATAPKVRESICSDCEMIHHEPPGSSVMCVKCGAWWITEAMPEDDA